MLIATRYVYFRYCIPEVCAQKIIKLTAPARLLNQLLQWSTLEQVLFNYDGRIKEQYSVSVDIYMEESI